MQLLEMVNLVLSHLVAEKMWCLRLEYPTTAEV
jgi:hypothetical protein